MERILIVMKADYATDCFRALESASTAASNPEKISFGLLLTYPITELEREQLQKNGTVRSAVEKGTTWKCFEQVWQGEEQVLMSHPAMRFARGWDRELSISLQEIRGHSDVPVALTGYLPRPTELVDAICPVAVERFDESGGIIFHRGSPLRFAARPQISAFLHPQFCFSTADFFLRLVATDEQTPYFIEAFRRRWALYTFHKPVLSVLWDEPIPPCYLPLEDNDVERFAQHYGLHLQKRRCTASAQEGIWTADLTFPLHVPFAVRMQEAFRNLDNRSVKIDPLVITSWLNVPGNPETERAMLRLRRLSSLKHLPLVCYTEPENIQRISRNCSYVREYKTRYGLPTAQRVQTADLRRYAELSIVYLLAQSREKELTRTHYIWIAPDYLEYPVYEKAAFDWETICNDRVSIALVNGQLDLNMIVLPDTYVLTVCREVSAICENMMLRAGRLPEAKRVWETLVHEHPNWFRLIELPKKREMFGLTMLGRGEEWFTRG